MTLNYINISHPELYYPQYHSCIREQWLHYCSNFCFNWEYRYKEFFRKMIPDSI